VRDDLHGLAEVLAAPLLLDHRLVDLAGGEVVALAHLGAGEALVMAQVEVGFGAVFGDEDLAVLERAHRARIDVDVGIELEVGDLDAAGFEDRPEEAAAMPLPREDTTPPVTKTYLVMRDPPPLRGTRAQPVAARDGRFHRQDPAPRH
jgi:hypothetical protein